MPKPCVLNGFWPFFPEGHLGDVNSSEAPFLLFILELASDIQRFVDYAPGVLGLTAALCCFWKLKLAVGFVFWYKKYKTMTNRHFANTIASFVLALNQH